jgi:hypothetical protein
MDPTAKQLTKLYVGLMGMLRTWQLAHKELRKLGSSWGKEQNFFITYIKHHLFAYIVIKKVVR